MTPSTLKLHASLIRFAKGMINAWEEWVKANQPKPEMDPDPVKHFSQHR